MKLSRATLLESLKQVAPAVKKSNLPCLECVRIEIKDGILRSDATHLDMGLSFKINVEADDFLMLIPLHPIFEILPTLVGDDLDLDVDVKTWKLKIKCGPAKTSLPLLDPEEFPPIMTFPEPGTQIDPKFLKSGLFAASDDPYRPVMMCANIEAKNESLSITTCDGFCVVRNKTQYGGAPFTALIPAAGLAQIMSWEHVSFTKTENNLIQICNGFHMLTAVQVDGQYPPVDQIIPKQKKGTATVSGLALATAIKQALVVSKNANMHLDFNFAPSLLSLSTHTDTEEFETQIEVECATTQEFTQNAAMFLRGIQAAGPGPVVIEWIDGKSPVTVKTPINPDWIYVQMPMSKG